ncbi:MAG: alpha-amylase/alpha-mannosidase [Planctomycetota bacterium]|nr:alpha-amylase/alpha-mannosidase [Planctomycetota bacterium]
MSGSIPVSIVWHQHQPYYKDLATGEMVLPWVRLHGIKDYYGMAKLVERCPGMRCTINMVPSLVAQLLDYVERTATDTFLKHTEIPAEDLTEQHAVYVLDHFFMAQWDRMIRVHPRFAELLELRRFGRRPAKNALPDFSTRDMRDLQVWFNLAWFHPLAFDEYESLRELRKKARDYTEDDKAELLKTQDQVLAAVLPLHAELVKRGQLEVTTTPFYHPIMPLLCDMRRAKEAMPRTPMPAGHVGLCEDAEAQVAKAVAFHEKVFGSRPVGMWPSEGSVSPDILPILQRHGLKWIATDEEILSASISTGLRGGFGKLERPDLLYRTWRAEIDGAGIDMVFRDHELSDLIGFQYQGWDGDAAAADFIARVKHNTKGLPAGGESLVTVILDGENCWEHYPDHGVKFLSSLYQMLSNGQHGLHATRVADFVNGVRPSRRLDRLFSGSWINHDFYIWIGHTEDRKAWEYVFRVREDLVRETQRRGEALPQPGTGAPTFKDVALAKAWEELYIAEGSDWYWWYGDDHTSGNDAAFDLLFRTHLKNIYTFLDLTPPFFLDDPIKVFAREGAYTKPTQILSIDLDGRASTYFEWIGAGRYRPEKEGGVMTAAAAPLVHQVFFGYEKERLCIRVDFHELEQDIQAAASEGHPASIQAAQSSHTAPAIKAAKNLRVLFAEPKGLALKVEAGPPVQISHDGPWPNEMNGSRICWDEVVEMTVPFKSLGLKPGEDVSFYIEVTTAGGASERFPRSGSLKMSVPPENIEEHEWMV